MKGLTNNPLDREKTSWSRDPWQTNTITSGDFGYYKIMAINYTLAKKLNKILASKHVRAANRYLQFYGFLAIFGSVKSWPLKRTYSAQKNWRHILFEIL